jgi:hypothetical protein
MVHDRTTAITMAAASMAAATCSERLSSLAESLRQLRVHRLRHNRTTAQRKNKDTASVSANKLR